MAAMSKYQCMVCGHVYDPAVGDPTRGIAPGTAFEDLCALSLVDIIVGPPSTFSGWASFVGGVPKVEIESAAEQLDMAAAFVTEF